MSLSALPVPPVAAAPIASVPATSPQDRQVAAERLRAASVVAFETAYGSGRRNDSVAAAADRDLLAQLDQARDADWSWANIDATLRHVHPRTR